MKQLLRYIVGGVMVLTLSFASGVIIPQQTYASCTDDKSCQDYCTGTKKEETVCREYFAKKNLSETWKLANTLDNLLSVLYLFAWPMMYVAGLAMDNTLVSGEMFGISGLLFQFWSIMRTIANVLIVLILVWIIAEQVFKGTKGAKEIGTHILAIIIGGVAINMSWWLLYALVDISTTATYGVGMLPVTIDSTYCNKERDPLITITGVNQIAEMGNCRPILSVNGTINISEALGDKTTWKAYYTYQPKNDVKKYFISCPFKQDSLTKAERDASVSGFVAFTGDNTEDFKLARTNLDKDYCVLGNQLLDIKGLSSTQSGIVIGSGDWDKRLVGGMQQLHLWGGERVRTLVDSNRGTIGLAYNLYGNLLGFATIKNNPTQATAEGQIIQFMIKLLFGFAMIFPLIALCIVLVMRVAVLWMVIGFAPILVLRWTFKLMGIKNDKLDGFAEGIGKKLTLSNVMSLLFQPVMIVFVLSVGMMFLEALQSTMTVDFGLGDVLQCDAASKCCGVDGMTNICLEQGGNNNGTSAFFNFFGYSIMNIVGIMLLYFMTFAVMKSSEITAAATEKIKDFGRSAMGALPVIPWFDGSFVGYDGAKAGLGKAWDHVADKYEDKTGKTITQPWVDSVADKLTGKVSDAQSAVTKAGEGFDVSQIKDDVGKRKEYAAAITKVIGEQKSKVKQATADELVSKTDPKIKALMDKYDADTMLKLLSDRQFIADSGKSAGEMLKTYAPGNDSWVGYKEAQNKYFKELKKQAGGIDFNGGTRGVITGSDGTRHLYEKVTKVEGGEEIITDLKAVGLSIGAGKTDFASVSALSGKVTKKEFEKLVSSATHKDPVSATEPGWKIVENKENKELVDVEKVDYQTPPTTTNPSGGKSPTTGL